MQVEVLKYLYDMEQACVLLSSFLVGKTFTDYDADPLLRSAVERQLMIVGEALNRLLFAPTGRLGLADHSVFQ
jgi:uncharacterized protein with HEPN domain